MYIAQEHTVTEVFADLDIVLILIFANRLIVLRLKECTASAREAEYIEVQEVLHGVFHLREDAHLQANGENVCRRNAALTITVGTAQCEHADDLLLGHLRARTEAEIHMVERSMRREEHTRMREACLGIECNLRQERLHLVEGRCSLADLEHRSEVAHRVAAPHADRARRAGMMRRAAEMHIARRMDIIEVRAEEVYMAVHGQPHIEDDVRELVVRIGNRRNGDEGSVDVDRTRELRQGLAPVLILRQMQRSAQRSVKERCLDRKIIHHEREVIVRRLYAAQFHVPRHHVAARPHASRTGTYDNAVAKSIDLNLHIRHRILEILDL